MDQARDLTWGARIAAGEEFPLVGPAMRNRIYLGATYYYFWSIPFLFSTEPVAAYVFAGMLGLFATALTFELGRQLAGARTGLLAAFVFATMPMAVIDGRVAWAPAAVPVFCAAFLLAAARLLQRGSTGAAMATAALAAATVQLHIAAAPIVLIAAVVLVWQVPRLGPSGFVAALLTGLVVGAPAVGALLGPGPPEVATESVAVGDPTAGRWLHLLALSSRAWAGLSPDPSQLPSWVRGWLRAETAWTAFVWVCAAGALLALPSVRRPGGWGVVLSLLAAAYAAVLLLPWEAWHYYADVTLVPAALVVGLVVDRFLGRPGVAALVLVGVARAVVLGWWLQAGHVGGYVATNLDLLRLGGAELQEEGRARVLSVRTRAEAAEALVAKLGFSPPDLWQRLSGPGFADLDTDNGYFVRRAAGVVGSDRAPAVQHATVVYRGTLPDEARRALPAPVVSGPFEIFASPVELDWSSGRLDGCGGGALPSRPAPAPLDYGDGALPRMVWPCDRPVVLLPLRSTAPTEDPVLVFARVDGSGRIRSLSVEPPSQARAVSDPPPGFGVGSEVSRAPAVVRVELEVDGPATLDLVALPLVP